MVIGSGANIVMWGPGQTQVMGTEKEVSEKEVISKTVMETVIVTIVVSSVSCLCWA